MPGLSFFPGRSMGSPGLENEKNKSLPGREQELR
jgi:hypothetical protein